MACAVYCIARDRTQVDALVERVRNAGVRVRDISVVLRAQPETPARNLPLWGLAFCAPVLWWPTVALARMESQETGSDECRHTVLSLTRYRAGIKQQGAVKKRRTRTPRATSAPD